VDARLGKNGPGRNAGEDHAGTQGCLRQEAMPPSVGRIALRSISGRNAGKEPLKK